MNILSRLIKSLRLLAVRFCPESDDCRPAVIFLCLLIIFPFDLCHAFAIESHSQQAPQPAAKASRQRQRPHSTQQHNSPDNEINDNQLDDHYIDAELLAKLPENDNDTIIVYQEKNSPYGLDGKKIFNPSPERAVWLSALCPGLGQIYNRRYWKLPIVVGGFMGLGYATNWNNIQYQDYTQGYRDLLDDDPASNSYMNFFPPNTVESDLDKAWLERTLRSRRDYYRRNRDLCIICCVGLYLLCMLDAYVDASMAHFDISPSLSMDVAPSLLMQPSSRRPAAGMTWALTF